MLAIRLSRTGKIHAPHYRIVVQEKRSKLNGKTIDIIGHYHPASKDKLLVVDKEKASLWLGRGAQASNTVVNLLVKEGVLPAEAKVHNFFTPTKKETAPVEEKAAESSAEETVEEPAAAEEAAESVASEEPAPAE